MPKVPRGEAGWLAGWLQEWSLLTLPTPCPPAARMSDSGLNLVEFVYVMIKSLGAFVVNQVDFVVQAVDLFRQVDVNDDGAMDWDEFTRCVCCCRWSLQCSLPSSPHTYTH